MVSIHDMSEQTWVCLSQVNTTNSTPTTSLYHLTKQSALYIAHVGLQQQLAALCACPPFHSLRPAPSETGERTMGYLLSLSHCLLVGSQLTYRRVRLRRPLSAAPAASQVDPIVVGSGGRASQSRQLRYLSGPVANDSSGLCCSEVDNHFSRTGEGWGVNG